MYKRRHKINCRTLMIHFTFGSVGNHWEYTCTSWSFSRLQSAQARWCSTWSIQQARTNTAHVCTIITFHKLLNTLTNCCYTVKPCYNKCNITCFLMSNNSLWVHICYTVSMAVLYFIKFVITDNLLYPHSLYSGLTLHSTRLGVCLEFVLVLY